MYKIHPNLFVFYAQFIIGKSLEKKINQYKITSNNTHKYRVTFYYHK